MPIILGWVDSGAAAGGVVVGKVWDVATRVVHPDPMIVDTQWSQDPVKGIIVLLIV